MEQIFESSGLPSDEQRRADRRLAEDRKDDGRKQCRGYPLDHSCPVRIPRYKASELCYGCEHTFEQERDMVRVANMRCQCGLLNTPEHVSDIIHQLWVAGEQERGFTNRAGSGRIG